VAGLGDLTLTVHPDRLLPADPGQRAIARELYQAVRTAPIISSHGHVDPLVLAEDRPFADPGSLFVAPDHYVTRLLHAAGVPPDRLGAGGGPLSEPEARAVWLRFCITGLFRGTAVGWWLQAELAEIFEVAEQPSAAAADALYDHVAARLALAAYRPRALFERFGIAALAATADPADDLSAYAPLAADPTWRGRVIPIFRPDRYFEAAGDGWPEAMARLGESAGVNAGDYHGYLRALEEWRRFFIAHGATSADHSHLDAGSDPLPEAEAQRIYRSALASTATAGEALAFRRHMLGEMARMSCDDGLVMTLHPGVRRNHHRPTFERFGPDTGHDIPVAIEFTEALRPLLERFGTVPGFHLVVFTADETVWSRELAPLAGFYPAVYLGVPWWFLDAPDALRRFRPAVTETAGLSRASGFVDDTHAFCSIPARHDMARRVDAGYLARFVAEHRLAEGEAREIAAEQVAGQPAAVLKL
jgi:glucuronate isomerase